MTYHFNASPNAVSPVIVRSWPLISLVSFFFSWYGLVLYEAASLDIKAIVFDDDITMVLIGFWIKKGKPEKSSAFAT